jgi:exportin-2 (importin alpha re-exporter)
MTLLTRMQQNKTNSYVYYFVYFFLYMLAINVDGLTPDYLIQTVDEIQPGYVRQLLLLLLAETTRPVLGYGLK